MIKAVIFDMGGTLEDIWVDEESERRAIEKLFRMLRSYGLDPGMELPAFKEAVDRGWKAYAAYRDPTRIELKPEVIWTQYILKEFHFPADQLLPHCEGIAHMWEVTHFHRRLRPHVNETLSKLREMGLTLGIISNTAAMFQVFDSLEEYGIREYFSDVTLSSVTGLRKPCEDIFTVSMRELMCRPEEAVYVGDTVSRDIIGSKLAGFRAAIQIRSKLTAEKDADVDQAYAPDFVIEDIDEVAEIVMKLQSDEKERAIS
jgi:putative hydrolase of the HAD superfamily